MSVLSIKTVTITNKGQISIPLELRKKSGFSAGTKINILAYEDHIELRTMKDFNEKMVTTYASESNLAKDWNSKEEDDAWKDL